jgi:hypothetical protein
VNTNELGFTVNLQPRQGTLAAQVVIDPTNLTLTEEDGKWVGSLQFVAIAGNKDSGQFDDPKTMRVNMKFPPEAHASVMKNGFTINHTFNLKPGYNQFRIAVQDVPSGALGSLVMTSRNAAGAPPATGSPRLPQ